MPKHCFVEPNIVSVAGIHSSVTVLQEAIFAKSVVIWTIGGRCDRKWNFRKYLRFENALRAYQRNALAFELKSLRQDFSRDDVTMYSNALREPVEGGKTNTLVNIGR